jgi:hypothetical protein
MRGCSPAESGKWFYSKLNNNNNNKKAFPYKTKQAPGLFTVVMTKWAKWLPHERKNAKNEKTSKPRVIYQLAVRNGILDVRVLSFYIRN